MPRLEEQLRMAIRLANGGAAKFIADATGNRGVWRSDYPRGTSLRLGGPGLHDASPLGMECDGVVWRKIESSYQGGSGRLEAG